LTTICPGYLILTYNKNLIITVQQNLDGTKGATVAETLLGMVLIVLAEMVAASLLHLQCTNFTNFLLTLEFMSMQVQASQVQSISCAT
jgi:hypothetical protein